MQLPKLATKKPRFVFPKQDSIVECDNLVNKKFNPNAPNEVWVSDITYVKVNNKFAFLCVIIDLFARKVVAWRTSLKADAAFVCDTLSMACNNREITKPIIFHSDRGVQYTCLKFRKFLDSFNFVQSFSKTAHPWDNAVAESFFKSFKLEELNRQSFTCLAQLNLASFEYIEGFYNTVRPHSANNFLSPNEKELAFKNTKLV